MPNIKSAAKRMRSDAKKRQKNQATLSELHTLYRKLAAGAKTNAEGAKADAQDLISRLDKAVTRGVIPHGRADRKKARIAKLFASKK